MAVTLEAIKFVAIIYKLSLTVAVIYKPSLTCRHLHADHSGTHLRQDVKYNHIA